MDEKETGIRLFRHSSLLIEFVQEDTPKAGTDTIPKKPKKKIAYLGIDAEQIVKEATKFLFSTPADIVVHPKDAPRHRRRIRKSRRTRRLRTIHAQQRTSTSRGGGGEAEKTS